MLPADFLDDVALLRRLYTRRFAELLRETGLNQAEMDVLLFLANNPPYDTARDIVRRRGLAKSHVSAAVESLAGKGLLARVYRDGNRKTVHLELKPSAAGPVARGQALQTAFFDEVLAGLTGTERRVLADFLHRIHHNLKEGAVHAAV